MGFVYYGFGFDLVGDCVVWVEVVFVGVVDVVVVWWDDFSEVKFEWLVCCCVGFGGCDVFVVDVYIVVLYGDDIVGDV